MRWVIFGMNQLSQEVVTWGRIWGDLTSAHPSLGIGYWENWGGLFEKSQYTRFRCDFFIGKRSQHVVRWNRGLRLVLSHTGGVWSKDLWIHLIEVQPRTRELFQLKEVEWSSDREVLEPRRGGELHHSWWLYFRCFHLLEKDYPIILVAERVHQLGFASLLIPRGHSEIDKTSWPLSGHPGLDPHFLVTQTNGAPMFRFAPLRIFWLEARLCLVWSPSHVYFLIGKINWY